MTKLHELADLGQAIWLDYIPSVTDYIRRFAGFGRSGRAWGDF